MTRAGAPVASDTARDLLSSVSALVSSGVEARWIVAHAAGVTTSDLVTQLDAEVGLDVSDAVRDLVDRRLAGEPLQYVLGTWAFRTLELHVDPRALIPRPETEQVVAAALDELGAQHSRLGRDCPVVAVDLGTGSGAIALSLAAEFEPARLLDVWATDVAAEAIELLGQNLAALADRHPDAAARVRVARGSWFDALPVELAGRLALVVSNPPYVSQEEWEELDAVVRDHEPKGALVPGPSGLEALDVLLREAPQWLAPGGSLVVELAPGQARAVKDNALGLGYENPEVREDFAGRPRMLVTRLPLA
jgi:release factor glutamine methyltransferase